MNLVVLHQGELVPIQGETLVLEEARTYEVHVPGRIVEAAHLGALPLGRTPAGSIEVPVDHEVGTSVLRLSMGSTEQTWPVRIVPRPKKLPPDLWAQMVLELDDWFSGTTVGLQGAKQGSVGAEGVSLPLLIEALTPLIESFEHALALLLRQLRELQRTALEPLPMRMAQRTDRETLAWLSKHPQVAQWADPWRAAELSGPEPTLPQRLPFDTIDHPVNRYIAWLVQRVCILLDEAATTLETHARNPKVSSTSWCEARAARLRTGAQTLKHALNRSALRHIPKKPATQAALMVLLDDPAYSRVHRLGRVFLSPMFSRLESTHPGASSAPSFTIYELWCFLAVQQSLASALPASHGWTWSWHGLDKLTTTLGDGTGAFALAIHPDHGRLELLFNPVFTAFLQKGASTQRWSISGQRRPDLVVTWKPKVGAPSWMSFDAKYRSGAKHLAEAFESAHIYRDALRYEGFGGRSAGCYLLAPAQADNVASWFSPSFRSNHGTGIWKLRPGENSLSDLGSFIVGSLGAPSPE